MLLILSCHINRSSDIELDDRLRERIHNFGQGTGYFNHDKRSLVVNVAVSHGPFLTPRERRWNEGERLRILDNSDSMDSYSSHSTVALPPSSSLMITCMNWWRHINE
jgi:hypothetical protein